MKKMASDRSKLDQPAFALVVVHPLWAPVALLLVAIGLVGAYVITINHVSFFGPEIARLFHFNHESNIPTWFSSSLWLIAALLAFVIYQFHCERGYPGAAYWFGMVPLFLFLSIDEAARIHEMIGGMLGRRFAGQALDTGFTYAWVYFGLGLFFVIGVLYLWFLIRLQFKFRVLFCISASIFVAGAVVIESFGAALESGRLEQFPLGQTWTSMIVYEEFLEMTGVILLIHTLLRVVALGKSPWSTRARNPKSVGHPQSPIGTTSPANSRSSVRYNR